MMYRALVKRFTPDRRYMSMEESVKILSHSLMQCGSELQTQVPEHQDHSCDQTNVFDFGCGQKIRSDAKGTIAAGPEGNSNPANSGIPVNCHQAYHKRYHDKKYKCD